MIYDKIENLELYKGFNKNIEKVLAFLKENDIECLKEGRYEIDEDNVFVMVQEYDSSSIEGRTYEAHDKYIDIQLVAEGRELIKYAARLGDEKILKTYPAENDIAMYAVKTTEQDVIIDTGYFALFAPTDLHMPCLQAQEGSPEDVKKFVFKLKA